MLLLADPAHLPGIGLDASESSLMTSMMGKGMYVNQGSSQCALSPGHPTPADATPYPADVASLQEQLAHPQAPHMHSIHNVQQPCARLSREISQSSDIAQNTCVAGVGQSERKSLGEESVNDCAVAPDETMDDIIRFFLKVCCLGN